MKRQRFYCFLYFVQIADIHLSGNRWNSTIDEKLEVNYLYNGQLRASCRAWTVICSSSSLSSTLRSTDIFFRKLGQFSDPVTTRSDKHACGKPMLTDPDKQAAGNREPTCEKFFRRDVQGGSNARYSWLVTARHMRSLNSLKEFTRIRKVRLRRVKTKKRKHNVHAYLPQIPKEIYSTNRRDWWLDNSGVENPQRRMWISEQSPVRCRGTKCRHSMDITRVKPKLHRRRRRFHESSCSRHRSQKLFTRTNYSNLASIANNYHGTME